ncbi:MAG: hypothetical protein MJE68_15715, partial [Proteobacteria bacterium]|nr:hypothetical protein [Pseudomonadota bacterium]
AKFSIVSSLDVMLKTFYDISQGSNNVSQFAIQLEKVLGNIRVSHPEALSGHKFSEQLRNRFFHGLSESLRGTLRFKYEQGCSYEDLLLSARQVEGEKFPVETTVVDSSNKTKAKAAAAQSKPSSDLDRLEKAYRCTQGELAKFQHQVSELSKLRASLQASSISSTPKEANTESGQTPQASQNSQHSGQGKKGYYNPNYYSNRGRGYGRGNGGRKPMPDPPGKPKGWSRLCYWCRDFVPPEEANHPIRECPFYTQGREEWWSMQPGKVPPPNSNTNSGTSMPGASKPPQGN